MHGKYHLMNLPLQSVLNIKLFKEIHHVWVGTKENVKTGLNPISICVLPDKQIESYQSQLKIQTACGRYCMLYCKSTVKIYNTHRVAEVHYILTTRTLSLLRHFSPRKQLECVPPPQDT